MKHVTSVGEKRKMPSDLRKVLVADSLASARWKGLTPLARRDFIRWIDDAAQEETRRRRIESIPSRLASGKRRPCCFAVVPMPLYKALGASPKAKATWKTLTSDERRDFIEWAKTGRVSRKQLIEQACQMLAQGRRKP